MKHVYRAKKSGGIIAALVCAVFPMILVIIMMVSFVKLSSMLLLLLALFLILMTWWFVRGMSYVLTESAIIVKCWPFRWKIPYAHITAVTPIKDPTTGFKVLQAFEGIEIFYQHGRMDSVKIGPKEQQQFLMALKEKSPAVEIAAVLLDEVVIKNGCNRPRNLI
ncbi:PH domain-containing protein [Bacillus sp. FSL W7-1360]